MNINGASQMKQEIQGLLQGVNLDGEAGEQIQQALAQLGGGGDQLDLSNLGDLAQQMGGLGMPMGGIDLLQLQMEQRRKIAAKNFRKLTAAINAERNNPNNPDRKRIEEDRQKIFELQNPDGEKGNGDFEDNSL